jgi:hypothetical protein
LIAVSIQRPEKIPLFFLFFFVPSPGMLDGCGGQEIEGCKVCTPNFLSAFALAIFLEVSYNSYQLPGVN